MTRSLTVLAADDGSSTGPDCADCWLCQKLYDWFGLDWLAENAQVLVATPAAVLLAEPESLGVEQITAEGVFLRVVVRATNADQWRVARELRMRLEERFVAEGFRTPLPLLAAAAGGTAGVR